MRGRRRGEEVKIYIQEERSAKYKERDVKKSMDSARVWVVSYGG